ncbi:MAG: hypothetical protein AAF800_01510 [Planctomycetota bacterium]
MPRSRFKLPLTLLAAATAAGLGSASFAEVITDGSFEAQTLGDTEPGDNGFIGEFFVSADTTATVVDGTGVTDGSLALQVDRADGTAFGAVSTFISSASIAAQGISTGDTLIFSGDLTYLSGTGQAQIRLFSNSTGSITAPLVSATTTSDSFSQTFTYGGDDLSFTLDTFGEVSAVVDNLSIVPEPGCLALCGGGLFMLVSRRRRPARG